MRINNQMVEHVRPVASRVRGSLPGPHSDEAHRVIAAELVACTLGQRRRPELRVMRTADGGVVTRIVRLPVR